MVSGQGSDKDKAIHALMKGLVETDHELAEAERRASRKPTEGLLNKGSLNTSREVLAYDKKSANDSDHWREYSDSLKAKAETVAKNSSKASAAESHIDTYNLSTAQSDLRSSTKGSSSLRVSKGSQAKYGFR